MIFIGSEADVRRKTMHHRPWRSIRPAAGGGGPLNGPIGKSLAE
jgi:hypothetical protein